MDRPLYEKIRKKIARSCRKVLKDEIERSMELFFKGTIQQNKDTHQPLLKNIDNKDVL